SVAEDRYHKIKAANSLIKENSFIPGGFLEQILENRSSGARSYLVWCNMYYSTSKRRKIYIKNTMMAENSPFFLYPEIIDEVSRYTVVPKEIRDAYKKR